MKGGKRLRHIALLQRTALGKSKKKKTHQLQILVYRRTSIRQDTLEAAHAPTASQQMWYHAVAMIFPA